MKSPKPINTATAVSDYHIVAYSVLSVIDTVFVAELLYLERHEYCKRFGCKCTYNTEKLKSNKCDPAIGLTGNGVFCCLKNSTRSILKPYFKSYTLCDFVLKRDIQKGLNL